MIWACFGGLSFQDAIVPIGRRLSAPANLLSGDVLATRISFSDRCLLVSLITVHIACIASAPCFCLKFNEGGGMCLGFDHDERYLALQAL